MLMQGTIFFESHYRCDNFSKKNSHAHCIDSPQTGRNPTQWKIRYSCHCFLMLKMQQNVLSQDLNLPSESKFPGSVFIIKDSPL